MTTSAESGRPLSLLSIVIPARDEEGCIGSTVGHLSLELKLHNIPHEVVVVDDGNTDGTWQLLQELQERIPQLKPVRNDRLHGFGRAVICGLDHFTGDAVVVMMADESDDCRDVVRYWNELNLGYNWTVIPITWRNRRFGVPKLKIKEMGRRYLAIFSCHLIFPNETIDETDIPMRTQNKCRQASNSLSRKILSKLDKMISNTIVIIPINKYKMSGPNLLSCLYPMHARTVPRMIRNHLNMTGMFTFSPQKEKK
jgi:glycosyltransferase involved in cell wall biosynthesis